MKNSILHIGIVLVTFTNICNASNSFNRKRNYSVGINNSLEISALNVNFNNDSLIVYELIEIAKINKIEKTADQLIAEDNAITENNFSNETQILDFNIINGNSIVEEIIESPTSNIIEKTADQLIAEDNLITENNISNETQILDFELINKKSNLVADNGMN